MSDEALANKDQLIGNESKNSFDLVNDEINLFNFLPLAVILFDSNGKVIKANEKAYEILSKEKTTLNKSYLQIKLYQPNHAFLFSKNEIELEDFKENPIELAFKNLQRIHNDEIIIEKLNGERFYGKLSINHLVIQEKESGFLTVIEDTSIIKKAELEAKEFDSRFRQLIEGMKAAVYTTDAEGYIILYNRAALDLWGREPIVGKDRWCGAYKILKVDGTNLPLNESPLAISIAEKRPVIGKEIIVIRPDGTLRHVAPYPQPLFDQLGRVIGAVNILVDVTEIKRTEKVLLENEKKLLGQTVTLEKMVEERTRDLKKKNEELKQSEERYHKMIEEVEGYAIILLDKYGIIQNWNKGAEKIKGYKDFEIIGKSVEEFYRKEDREERLPNFLIQEAREKGKAIHEGWRLRKDGTMFWGSIVITALHNEEGDIIGFSKVTRDLTERKLSEDKLREYSNELEFQNKELEQFAYAASHDMKEPLRKIHLYNSYIYENASELLDARSKEYLNRSLNATIRMSELIEDILTYSKSTSSSESIEEVSVYDVLKVIMLLHKEELDQKKVVIDFDELPVIKAVPFQFKQLIDNLINNAIKYKHPDRDVRIYIKSEVVNGWELQEREADPDTIYNKISVIDNGVGFDIEHSEKIFEIFQRLNNQSGARGSGIGLSICKKIVQNHKGFIKAFGKINEGAQFDIYLPKD